GGGARRGGDRRRRAAGAGRCRHPSGVPRAALERRAAADRVRRRRCAAGRGGARRRRPAHRQPRPDTPPSPETPPREGILMRRTMLKSKIHRATITGSDLNYVGSITIDADLLDASDILEHEQVTVVDVNNGSRFETYTIAGERGTGVIQVNGAAARLVHAGDTIIVISYAEYSRE